MSYNSFSITRLTECEWSERSKNNTIGVYRCCSFNVRFYIDCESHATLQSFSWVHAKINRINTKSAASRPGIVVALCLCCVFVVREIAGKFEMTIRKIVTGKWHSRKFILTILNCTERLYGNGSYMEA